MTQHACDIMCCCLVGTWIKGLELRRGAWAEDSSVVVFPCGWLLKTKKWVTLSREDRQRKEKQAQDRTQRNSKSKGKSGGRKHIKVIEKYVVSVEKICFGTRQLWPYVSGQVMATLRAFVSPFSMGQ